VKITVALVRTLVMLGLGSAGMTSQLFFVAEPNMILVSASIGLMLGPAALEAWLRARTGAPDPPPTTTVGSSPPPSPSPPHG
jgi:hypothetical protein